MINIELNPKNFDKALTSLESAYAFAQSRVAAGDCSQDERAVLKAGVVRYFEYAYELSWRFIRRLLTLKLSSYRTLSIARSQLFRMAYVNDVIDDCDKWTGFHELRLLTANSFDDVVADAVYSDVGEFIACARKLWGKVKAKRRQL